MVLFLFISGLLARFLSVENVERDADLALVQAETAGDAQRLVDRLAGCRRQPACVALARANAARLRRAGSPKILTLGSPTAYSLTGAQGKTRLAWSVIGQRPVVQCLLVRRSGNFITGITVTLLAISAPIDNEGVC